MNVMDVIKAWFALISASGTTLIMFQSRKYMILSALNAVSLLPKLV